MRNHFIFGFAIAAAMIPVAAQAQEGSYAGISLGVTDGTYESPDDVVFPRKGMHTTAVLPGIFAGHNILVGDVLLGIEAAGSLPRDASVHNEKNPGYMAPLLGADILVRRTFKNVWRGSVSGRVGYVAGPWSFATSAGFMAAGVKHHQSRQFSIDPAPYSHTRSSSIATGPVFGLEAGYDMSESVTIGFRLEQSKLRDDEPVKAGNGSERQRFNSTTAATRFLFRF